MSDRTETLSQSQPLGSALGDARAAFELSVAEAERYQLVTEVGHGGSGRILLARDRRLGRDVAYKEQLRPGRGVARFVREATITAQLQHPAIVPLHDAALRPDGSPFYVMKLVTGRSLAQVVELEATLAGRIALLPSVIAVADAVAYAHSKGIIHRDIKPQNVLVGEFGETTLIDWGLAKYLDDDEPAEAAPVDLEISGESTQTAPGSILGTPAYMAPEQARGDKLDERADVYALGALLYHILAGGPPFRHTPETPVLAQVRQGTLEPLGQRVPGVPAELAAIVHKAMSHDPAARYPSARQVADDLKRFQSGRLVAAYEYTRLARVVRWAQQHRAAVTAGALAAVAILIVSVFAVGRILVERDRAQRQQAAAEKLVQYVISDLRDRLRPLGRLAILDGAAQQVDEYYRALEDVSGGLTLDVLDRRAAALRLYSETRAVSADVKTATALRDHELAIRHYLLLAEPHDPAQRYRLATALLNAGTSDENAGAHQMAHVRLTTAGALLEELVARDPEQPDWLQSLADAQMYMAVQSHQRGHIDQAVPRFLTAIATYERVLAKRPDNHDLIVHMIDARTRVADLLRFLDRNPEAEQQALAAQAVLEPRLAAEPEDATWLSTLGDVKVSLCNIWSDTGRIEAAVAAGRDAVALAEKLVTHDPLNVGWKLRLGDAYTIVGHAEQRADDFAAARKHGELAVATVKGVLAQNPKDVRARRTLWYYSFQLAETLLDVDRPAALALYRETLDVTQPLIDAEPGNPRWIGNRALSQVRVGEALMPLGRSAEAVPFLVAARDTLTALRKQQPGNTGYRDGLVAALLVLGWAEMDADDLAGGKRDMLTAVEITTERVSHDDSVNARSLLFHCYARVGLALFDHGVRAEGRTWLQKAHDAARALQDSHEAEANVSNELKEVEARLNKP